MYSLFQDKVFRHRMVLRMLCKKNLKHWFIQICGWEEFTGILVNTIA